MQTKIVFFDIDDTLYRKNKKIPNSVHLAFQKLHAAGIQIGIATGRTRVVFPAEINELIAKYNVDFIVCINGQYCSYHNEEFISFPIQNEYKNEIVDLCKSNNISYAFINEDGMFTSDNKERIQESLKPIGDYQINPEFYKDHNVYQILLFIDKEEENELIKAPIFSKGFKMVRWHELSVDILETAGSKARGVLLACEKLGIDITETMAFGDGLNDLELAKAVGFFVAMGDAKDELKKQANYITGTIEEDGIYNALIHLGVIK